jgi:tetratricopeptide (TPR) repeat protein
MHQAGYPGRDLFFARAAARADVANTHQAQKDAAYAAFELGKYGEAITQFEHAYRLKRDPRLLYNIALAYFRRYELYRRAPDLQQARNLFRRFLLLVPLPEARSPKREQVRKARQFSQSYLTRIEEVLAKAKSTAQQPASRPQYSKTDSRQAAPGDPKRKPNTEPAKTEPAPTGRSRLHWVFYGLAAATGVAAAITGGLALHEDGRSDDLAKESDPAADAAADRSERYALATDILAGAAIASAVVAVILHVRTARAPEKKKTTSAELLVAPGSASLRVRF